MIGDLSAGARVKLDGFGLLLSFMGSLLLLLLIAPLVGLLFSSSLGEVSEAIADTEVTHSIFITLAAGILATIFCTLLGIPLAYLLARKKFWGKSFALALIDLPIIIPHSVAGIALLTVVGRNTFLQSVLGDFVGSTKGIAVAMAFVSVPFLLNAARAGFEAVPTKLEKAARTLGATPLRVFFTISLPLAWREVVSGMVLMWARGISEFGAVIIIAYHPMTTPVLIYQRYNDFGLSYARGAAIVLLVICVVIFAILRFLSNNRSIREDRQNARTA